MFAVVNKAKLGLIKQTFSNITTDAFTYLSLQIISTSYFGIWQLDLTIEKTSKIKRKSSRKLLSILKYLEYD